MTKRYENVLETIGNTPVIRLNKLSPPGINLYVKSEAYNPMGSVKDRLALGVIEDAERKGLLKPGQTVVEATSGNTGIGLAMVCAQKGYPLVITMAESFSVERRRLMRFLGARVVLTPAAEKGTGMVKKAEELAAEHGWFLTRQFDNEANPEMHQRTTAPEILEAFEGDRLDYWVTGFGTCGTLKGVAQVLRKERPETKIIACEPDNSALFGSGIPQARNADGTLNGSHPSFRPHLMQGWAPDFIADIAQSVIDQELFDELLPIDGQEALRLSRALATEEGIFVGITSGATLAGAIEICKKAEPGANVLCMLPDTGERYLSTPLFEDIPEEMTEEEHELSRSTANFRFDQSGAAPAPAQAAPEPEVTESGNAFVEEAIANKDEPVVLFALEWCEFCWSVRRMFAKYGIPFKSIDLDSTAYQEGNRGGEIRNALNAKTSIKTIPQIFVGGKFIGGCTELFDAQRDGSLKALLEANSVGFNTEIDIDPYTFLPKWLQPR